jgi:hypothetical protein
MTNVLNGNWTHRSFCNVDSSSGPVLAVPWAPDGALTVTTDPNGSVTGQLTFSLAGKVLSVTGQIHGPMAAGVAAPWPMPASVELSAVTPNGTAEYRLRGWFIPNTNSVVGTVMAIKDDLALQPDGTLGSWVLVEDQGAVS